MWPESCLTETEKAPWALFIIAGLQRLALFPPDLIVIVRRQSAHRDPGPSFFESRENVVQT